MEKGIIMVNSPAIKKIALTIRKFMDMIYLPIEIMSKYYSKVLEREINFKQTKAITEAQIAFFASIFPLDYNLALRFLAVVWFISTLLKCRKIL